MSAFPSTFQIEGPGGQRIRTPEDWHRYAPPKKPQIHWQDGRSAKESARAWLGHGTTATVPREIATLLETCRLTRGFEPVLAIPECVTKLDDYAGEHRNHDLLVVGLAAGGQMLLAIEAKADESFGDHSVDEYLTLCERREHDRIRRAEEARLAGKRLPRPSNAARRIQELCAAVFGHAANDGRVPDVARPLRYQLIAALAGALIEAHARECAHAVLVVHEFLSKPDPACGLRGTDDKKVAKNVDAWQAFNLALTGDKRGAEERLAGPVLVPGSPRVPNDIPVLIGKASRHLS